MLVSKRSTALCSGNHDAVDVPAQTVNGIRPSWLNAFALFPHVLLDGQSRDFQRQLTVTVLGYLSNFGEKRAQLQAGQRLVAASGHRWLVVHHHPPAFAGAAGPEECAAGELLQEFAPTVWCYARYFRQPYRNDFRRQEIVGSTTVINLSQMMPDGTRITNSLPNHVIWNVEPNVFSWTCSEVTDGRGSKSTSTPVTNQP